jgi:signal transduction histidine kinase/ActR/RegA family two-component response regulator
MAQTDETLRTLDRLRTALLEAEADQRGFLLTGDAGHLAAFQAATGQAREALRELRALTAGDAAQQQRIDTVDPLLDRRLTRLREATERPDGQIRVAAEQLHTEDGRKTVAEILRALEEVRQAALSARAEQARAAEATALALGLIAVMATVLAAGAGAALVILIRRDLAWRRDAEETARRALAAAAAEHQALRERLRRALRLEAVGRLAGGVAHEFNNLVTVVNGCCDLLRLRLPAADPAREMLDAVGTSGERIAGLARQLVVFGRRASLQPRPTDVNALVTDLGKILGRLLGEDVALSIALDPDLGPVHADRAQLEQLVICLALDARQAMPRGGELTVETRGAGPGDRGGAGPGSEVCLVFRRAGPGESEAATPDLQAARDTLPPLGGRLEVHAAPGQGTTVTVRLPRGNGRAPAATAERAPAVASGGTETVLVVEDDRGVRRLAADSLRSRGYTVLEAADGAEALRVAQGHAGTIHLLITDVVIPRMSGRALADHLLAARPSLKVLYVSGYPAEAVSAHGVPEEGVAFLEKPFNAASLAAAVRAVLGPPAGGKAP